MNRKTQRGAILGLLVSARGQWIGLPEIVKLAAQYNSRIHELRKLGFAIENKIRDVDGIRHSWFRLIPSPERLTIAHRATQQPDRRFAATNKRPAFSQEKPMAPSSGPAVQQPLFADRHQDD